MRSVTCTHCGARLRFLMKESFQKGDSGAWVGNLSFHFKGGFEMEVYACGSCGKLEFFLPEEELESVTPQPDETEIPDYNTGIAYVSKDGIPQIRCPKCGHAHDFDCPRCPRCEYVY